jgi:predicted transcriptional regulator
LKPPCEIVVTKILPHIRAGIVKTLTHDYHMKQIDVARTLGITQASVSQYLSSTRGEDEEFQKLFPELEEYAKIIAEKIASGEGKVNQMALLCEACSNIRNDGKFCEYHKGLLHLDKCGICYETPSKEDK